MITPLTLEQQVSLSNIIHNVLNERGTKADYVKVGFESRFTVARRGDAVHVSVTQDLRHWTSQFYDELAKIVSLVQSNTYEWFSVHVAPDGKVFWSGIPTKGVMPL